MAFIVPGAGIIGKIGFFFPSNITMEIIPFF
jgi:hypothetical protein